MSSRALTVARRVMLQVVRDRRTIALLVVVPLVIASIAGVSIPNKMALDNAAPAVLATLILFFGFLITGISFLRERTQGTLERLLASPISRMDIVAGYLLGLLLFALVQTLILFFYMVYVLDVSFQGDLWQILVFQMLIGINAVCLGTFFSAFARNEFQMIQFIPLIIIPQVFLCGLFIQISQYAGLPAMDCQVPAAYLRRGGNQSIDALWTEPAGYRQGCRRSGGTYAVGLLMLAALTLRRGSSA